MSYLRPRLDMNKIIFCHIKCVALATIYFTINNLPTAENQNDRIRLKLVKTDVIEFG